MARVGPQRHRKKKKIISYLISGSSSFDSRSQWPRGLRRRSAVARLLRFGFESHRGHGCLSVVSVVCCQVEVSATG